MAGLSNSLCISQYSPSVDLMYDGELPVFSNKEECLKKIKLYLNDKNLLKEATEKFCKKSLEYEDSKYIDKIGNFLEAINIKDKEHFLTPIWYNQIFINQSMRLRFKRTFMKTFLQELINNALNLRNKNILTKFHQFFFSIIIFIRYLPFLFIKFILGLIKKWKKLILLPIKIENRYF